METRNVQYILPAQSIDMGGFPVKQALPTQRVQQHDPFLLVHHANIKVIKDRPAKHQGVGPHPHRGFSPVTFVIGGELHHRDSRGNSQVAKAGEVQWMHAGMGLIHSERPSQALVDQHGRQEIIQLWINVPASKKMVVPSYHHLDQDSMPSFSSNDGRVFTKLVAGNYKNLNGRVETMSPLLILWSTAKADSEENFQIPSNMNAMLYVIKGNISMKGFGLVENENLVIFEQEGDLVTIRSNDEAQYLLLCGQPINEKIVQYGPYVMNSETEIMEAMRDYQMGKMGILVET